MTYHHDELKSDQIRLAIIEYNSPEYQQSLKLREELLRKPLGLSITREDINEDKQQTHIGVFRGDLLIGNLCLQPVTRQIVKLRQMAIAPPYQGKGIGRQLVQYAEQYAITQHYQQIQLHARCQFQGFYTKLGYKAQGNPFFEVTIPHIFMTKKLN